MPNATGSVAFSVTHLVRSAFSLFKSLKSVKATIDHKCTYYVVVM